MTDVNLIIETMTKTMNATLTNDKYSTNQEQRTAYLAGMRELAEAVLAVMTAEQGGR